MTVHRQPFSIVSLSMGMKIPGHATPLVAFTCDRLFTPIQIKNRFGKTQLWGRKKVSYEYTAGLGVWTWEARLTLAMACGPVGRVGPGFCLLEAFAV